MNYQPQEPTISASPFSIPAKLVPFRRIVVGYDGSHASENTLKIADLVAKEFGSDLLIVNSVSPTPSMLGVVGQPAESVQLYTEQIRLNIEKDLHQRGISTPFKVLIELDTPVHALVKITNEYEADLLVVGTRGRYGIGQFLRGSVSQSVVGRVNCPVLILGPEFVPQANMFQTVLFATDLNKTGISPAQYAGRLADKFYCDLLLLHVIPQKPHAEGRMREWVEENTTRKLDALIDPDILSNCNYRTLIAYGDPAEEILAAADSQRADLIILGARKPTPLDDHASWSTLTGILRDARCPVLVVGS
jgi:nucleotide-binding universal stress UspA family protein